MTELAHILERLGLSQYLAIFVSEGFDTWETLQDITESDLDALKVKLGHRRKLQRAIVEARGQGNERTLPIDLRHVPSIDGSYRSDESGTEGKAGKRAGTAPSRAGSTSTKRKYRRHPKPDEHAPERPPSAYVIFSNQMREVLKGQDLSFTEIAKIVGERWQVLSPGSREACERQAASAKEKYYAELAEYKKTPQYSAYQEYLADFKAKHATPRTEMKRAKLETETSTSTRSSSHDHTERAIQHRSSGYLEGLSSRIPTSGGSPPLNTYPSVAGQSVASMSPATYSISNLNSPVTREHYSPMSVSPVMAPFSREPPFELPYQPAPSQNLDFRERYQRESPYALSSHHSSHSQTPSATHTPPWQPGSSDYSFQHPSVVDVRSRRIPRELGNIPTLSHEETTLSSNESISHMNVPYQRTLLPPLDASKADRTLPQPVPTPGAVPSPLHHLPPATTPPAGGNPDYGRTSSWPALLRAGELAARDADNQPLEKPKSPP